MSKRLEQIVYRLNLISNSPTFSLRDDYDGYCIYIEGTGQFLVGSEEKIISDLTHVLEANEEPQGQ